MEIQFSSLIDNISLMELLTKELHYSKNVVKKFLTKKQYEKIITQKEVITCPIDLINNNLINPIFVGHEIEVLYEDDNFIVVNKNENSHGHGLLYSENNTVLNFLRKNYNLKSLSSFDENKERGLLYRLDHVTSGVLIFVKDANLHIGMRDKFSELVKTKKYLAIVEGKLEIDQKVSHILQGSGEGGHKVKEDSSGILCEANFKTVFSNDLHSLIQVELQTGFRHQIRAQLSLLGHPIVGDILYGASEESRVYLHALEYGFRFNEVDYKFMAQKNELFCKFLHANSLLEVIR